MLTLRSHAWMTTARRGGDRRNRPGERRGRGGEVEDAAVDFRRPRLELGLPSPIPTAGRRGSAMRS